MPLTWFVAEAVFQASVRTEMGDVRLIVESLLFLVQALDHPSALAKAVAIARGKEHSYQNEQGEQVRWSFIGLVEVTEMIDQQFDDGAELRSTMNEA